MDLILRATVVYFFILVLLRAAGKRELGQLSPIDFVVLLILSETMQSALTKGDQSVFGSLILGTTLVFWHGVVSYASYKSRFIRDLISGLPVVLVKDGRLQEKAMLMEQVPEDDILSEARAVGLERIDQIKEAVLETTGQINIIPQKEEPHAIRKESESNVS